MERFEGEGGEEQLLEHLRLLYSKAFFKDLRQQMDELRKRGMEAEVQELLGRFKERLCRLEPFMKELKQRLSRRYNKHHGRSGTPWIIATQPSHKATAGRQERHFRCPMRHVCHGWSDLTKSLTVSLNSRSSNRSPIRWDLTSKVSL